MTTPSSSRRGWLLALGVLVVVGGLVAAGALWFASGQRLDDNIKGFARAPSGCATTLDFDRTGQFTLYVETVGTMTELAGDCSSSSSTYDSDEIDDPQVELVDADGEPVEIEISDGDAYDAAGFAGTQLGVVEVEESGDHVLTVAVSGAPFAIAVGGDVNAGVTALRWVAVMSAIVAFVGGGLLLVIASRRPASVAAATDPWQPSDPTPSTWPAGPPGFPAPPPTTGAAGPAGPPLVPQGAQPAFPSPVTSPTAPPASPPSTPPDSPSVPSAGSPPERPAPPTWGPPSISSDA